MLETIRQVRVGEGAVKTAVQLKVVFVVFFVLGCASGISKQTRSQVTFSDSFKILQADPDKYTGETVLLGGKILKTLATSDSSEITWQGF